MIPHIASLLLSLFSAFCAQADSSGHPEGFTKLADGVFAHVVSPDGNAVSNSGVVILESGVLVFDTHFTPEAAQLLLSRIRSITSKAVRYLVNSHFHPDHTHGNQVFVGAHQILGTTSTRRDMLERDIPALQRTLGVAQSQLDKLRRDYAQEKDTRNQARLQSEIQSRQQFVDRMTRLRVLAPNLTLEDSLSLLGDIRRLHILHLGRGHTAGDLVLYLPEEKIVFAGDLFFNESIPNTQDAALLEWVETLDKLLELEADRFVPGHGAVGSREDVRKFKSYLEELRTMVEPAVKRGDTLEQVLRDVSLPAAYSRYRFQNFFPANVQRIYLELKALHPQGGAEKPR